MLEQMMAGVDKSITEAQYDEEGSVQGIEGGCGGGDGGLPESIRRGTYWGSYEQEEVDALRRAHRTYSTMLDGADSSGPRR